MGHHHHKPNKAVAGDPDDGHGRGMPRRPDGREAERRTEEDRREVGLPDGAGKDDATRYAEERAEVEREANQGTMPRSVAPRKKRNPFPPSGYGK
ncbi:hypothetical protein [Streptomyces benahoarensis]|uniref:Uncharacterized protein n=1 Tax=Streptomyces benahoarensis TaxID=2595054 RepID=A0A553XKL1_9ACTN|nr:hypothetical protein [Streptomyces benahoarensis]TSB08254.1 hypothetical protein FNJ62_30995 [Streptomyces benahoarensis]TSB17486.1 hypothetical protein FNZ23_30595 [Streptomyces benahoarensis]